MRLTPAEPAASSEFVAFFEAAEPRLRRALGGRPNSADEVAAALAWAWEHWEQVRSFDNPVGYLYRVARSSTRHRREGLLDVGEPEAFPAVEPALVPAMHALPRRQRTAVWLVVACGFTHAEAAVAMGLSRSAVGTHVARGMAALRAALQALDDERGSTDDARRH